MEESPETHRSLSTPRASASRKRIVLLGSAALLICLLLAVPGAAIVRALGSMDFAEPMRSELDSALTPRGRLEPVNILLAGVDRAKQGKTRADTIMVLRVDPLRRQTWILSLPRDTNIGLKRASCSRSPAAAAALSQATERSPNRSTLSDGICASDEHNRQNPLSDHRWGNAFDLTHDSDAGIDCVYIAERIRRSRDARVKYLIFKGRYFSDATGWRWRTYDGSNPHDEHMHVSIREEHRDDEGAWPGITHDARLRPLAEFVSILRTAGLPHAGSEHPLMSQQAEASTTKLNSAYAYGGPSLLVDSAERLLGIPIHHYVEIDFAGLSALVDAVGGVRVNNPSEIVDRKAASASADRRAYRISAGEQVLDGEHALTFVRSRRYVDGDFGRVRNQQLFLRSLAKTLLSPRGLASMPRAVYALSSHVHTDLGVMGLLRTSFAIGASRPTDASSATLAGTWRSPVVILDDARKAELVNAMSSGDRFLPAPGDISVTILNGTNKQGAATRLARMLYAEGFGVTAVGNAKTVDYQETTVYVSEQDREVGRRIQLSIPHARISHDPERHGVSTDALIIVGQD